MEITLSEKDMDALAATLERRITERVVGLLAAGEAFEAIGKSAHSLAMLHVNQGNFTREAIQAMCEHLKKDGEKLLRQIVTAAVREVREDDPELRKAIAKGVYEAARDHAERLRASDDQF